jgi:2-oxoglutarate ferredoxin oxidoreductase subunit delta
MARGMILIDKERCKGCGLCIAACPQKILAFSGEFNQSGYNVVHAERPESCLGCGFCALNCPDVAIEVYREKVAV